MSTLLSIDPGTHHYGLAYWKDGSLERAWFAKKDDTFEFISLFLQIDEIACERPQVYLMNLKAANDLVGLALSAGELCGALIEHCVPRPRVTYYLPATWKGQVRKEIHHPRVRAELSYEELHKVEVLKNKKHAEDVWDAVGIGLYHLKRIERGKRAA
jgi:hypothetical protein